MESDQAETIKSKYEELRHANDPLFFLENTAELLELSSILPRTELIGNVIDSYFKKSSRTEGYSYNIKYLSLDIDYDEFGWRKRSLQHNLLEKIFEVYFIKGEGEVEDAVKIFYETCNIEEAQNLIEYIEKTQDNEGVSNKKGLKNLKPSSSLVNKWLSSQMDLKKYDSLKDYADFFFKRNYRLSAQIMDKAKEKEECFAAEKNFESLEIFVKAFSVFPKDSVIDDCIKNYMKDSKYNIDAARDISRLLKITQKNEEYLLKVAKLFADENKFGLVNYFIKEAGISKEKVIPLISLKN